MGLVAQIVWLFVLALPIACIAWTVTQEEVFHELHQYAERQVECAQQWWKRKFFYLLTCHYCFSHYVAALFLIITRFRLLYDDWRGYLVALFALVWVANLHMSVYNRIRLDIKHERIEIKAKEEEVDRQEEIAPREAA